MNEWRDTDLAPVRPHEWLEKITHFSKDQERVPGLEESGFYLTRCGSPGGVVGKCLTWLFPCPCWVSGLGGAQVGTPHSSLIQSFSTRTCSQTLTLQEILFWYLPRVFPVFLYFSNCNRFLRSCVVPTRLPSTPPQYADSEELGGASSPPRCAACQPC